MKRLNLNTIRLTILLLLAILLHSSITAFAQAPGGGEPDSTLKFRLAIKGSRTASPLKRWVMNGDDVTAAVRHCNYDYLFPTYVGSVDTYTLFTRNSLTGRTPYATQWRIYEDGVFTYPPGGGFASGTEGVAIPWSFTTPGYKYFQFIVSDPDFWVKPDTIVARILVMNQVTDLNINMPTLCLETFPSGTDYKFTVETIPPVETVFPSTPTASAYWNGSHCETYGDLQLTFKFQPHSYGSFTIPPRAEFAPWASSGFGEFWLGGFSTLTWPMFSAPVSPWEDVKKFYYRNTDIIPYATTNNVPITGTFSYNDGVTLVKRNYIVPITKTAVTTTENNAISYLIWEYNKTSPGLISSHTAEPFGTIHAPAHETWTPTNNPMVNEGYGDTVNILRIKDKLVIGKGQSLTIKDMTLEMGKDAQIIVESDNTGTLPAGRLMLDNATIKAYRDCANEESYWGGIVLQGNNAKSQENIGGSFYNRYQAMLFMSNNSKLAQANVAVRSYDPANPSTRAGGIVYAYNSSFENNKVSVDIAAYYNPTVIPFASGYAAKFDKCNFTYNDDDLKSDFEGFVKIDAVKDIPFYSCHFTTNFGSIMLGYGIKAYDASLLVRGTFSTTAPCYFKGLMEAVSANKTAFGTSNTLYINNTNFAQNYSGVYSRAINNSYMHNNSFQIPSRPFPAFGGRNCTGVNMETGSGYTLTSNIFGNVPASSSAHNNAVLVWNSGSADNSVKDNTVSNLSQGMISNYINTNGSAVSPSGLQFLCNAQSSNVGTCIAALGADPTQDGMRARQGENSLAAGNTFAHLIADIYNPTAQVGAVNYFHNSAPNAEPTILVGSASKSLTVASDGCAASTLPISTSPTTTASGTMGTVFFGLPTPITSTSGLSGIALREALLHNVTAYSFATEMPNRISLLHNTYAALGDAYSDLERVDLYLQTNELEAANSLYNGIVANRNLSGTEAYEFSHWGRQLLDISIDLRQANKSSKQINATQVGILASIADSARMWAKVRAQNWLQLYDGRSSINTFLYPPITSGGNQRQVLESSITGGDAAQNAVYPNPATDNIMVNYIASNDKENNIQIQLTDLLGRVVLQQPIANKGSQKIAIDKLSPGLYFYTIREQNNITLSGKLVKK